jgi:phage protein D
MPNYFAPAFKVEINDAQLSADISKNIEEVSVTSEKDSMNSCSLTVANTYPEMRWTHTSDATFFQEGNSVKVSMGYVDDLQEIFNGEITSVTSTFPASGAPTVKVDAKTRLHWLQGDKKTKTFQSMTDKQIAEQIGQKLNLTVQAEDAQIQYDYVMQPNQTDLEFLRERARRIHFEVLVEDKTLIFRKAKEADSEIFTLVWGNVQAGLGGGPNTLPLKSFSPTINTSNQVKKVTVRGYDPKSKQQIVGEATAQDTTMGRSKDAGNATAAAFGKSTEYVRVNAPVASHAEAVALAQAILNQRAMGFVTGTAETIGVPELQWGKVVMVQGVGPRFSGKYYIERAVHTLGGGGYGTSLSLNSNSTNSASSSSSSESSGSGTSGS